MTETGDKEQGIAVSIVILTHEAATLKFAKDTRKRVYRMKIPSPPEPWTGDDFVKHSRLFLETLKPPVAEGKLLMVEFTYINVLCLYCVQAAMEKKGISLWLTLSFFDTDETILSKGKRAEALLEKKVDLIDKMIDFPFIKKLDTPADGIISHAYLKQIITEHFIE